MSSRTLRVGSQCAGYGGIEMALQQHLDVEHAWYAEVNEAASKVLAHHYPGVPNHGDITVYDWAQAERVNVFTSGFPCQPMSNAGKRLGSADERHLWPTGVLPAIRELMPPLVVLENVPGLLTIENGQVFAKILADLDDLGYTVSWTVVGACRVGACHHRHRVFIAATLAEVRAPMSDPIAHRSGDGWGLAQFVLFGDAEAVRWPTAGFTSGGTAWELPADNCGIDGSALPTPTAALGDEQRGFPSPEVASRRFGLGRRNLDDAVAMLLTPVATDGKHNGSPGDMARKSPNLGALVTFLPTPTVADSRGTRNATAGRSVAASTKVNAGWTLSDVVYDGQIQSMMPTPRASDADKGGPNQRGSAAGDWMLPTAVQPERFGKYAAAVHRHELAYGLAAPDPTEPGRNGRPRLSADFPSFMQGLPPGWLTDVVDRKDALRLAGNGVNPRQAAYALSTLPTFQAAVKALTRVEVSA
jgi:DNA (cytosine-5)-methyltransferase 1